MSILEDDIDNLYQTSLAITRNVHIELFGLLVKNGDEKVSVFF